MFGPAGKLRDGHFVFRMVSRGQEVRDEVFAVGGGQIITGLISDAMGSPWRVDNGGGMN